jgi:hypothetical protein
LSWLTDADVPPVAALALADIPVVIKITAAANTLPKSFFIGSS